MNNADGLDDFTRILSADDARIIVDLLKLAVGNRSGPRAKEILSTLLIALSKASLPVRDQSTCFLSIINLDA